MAIQDFLVLLKTTLSEQSFIQLTLSQLRDKQFQYKKVVVKPVEIKRELFFQLQMFTEQQVKHQNVTSEELIQQIEPLLEHTYRQALLQSKTQDVQLLLSKKGKGKLIKHAPTKQEVSLQHDRSKHYLLEEGKPISFLIELGVMNQEGQVVKKKYDKFKQINRFLELVHDVIPQWQKQNPGKTLNIVDFGCGKSYLTFALYHYLNEIAKVNCQIIGLDLKREVIEHCQALAEKCAYNQLRFQVGDIAKYKQELPIHMVVTLHACDTATDAALVQAMEWHADIILSVPCCQHELNKQIEADEMQPLMKHGLLKERFAALATDALRAQVLSILGYKTQVIEFIDLEHTPKNILIRAYKTKQDKKEQEQLVREYLTYKQFLKFDTYIERACKEKLSKIINP